MSSINSQTATRAKAVTPSDALSNGFSSLWIGGAGDVAVVTAGGDTVTFAGCGAGTPLPVQVSKVLLTGTTATLILGLA